MRRHGSIERIGAISAALLLAPAVLALFGCSGSSGDSGVIGPEMGGARPVGGTSAATTTGGAVAGGATAKGGATGLGGAVGGASAVGGAVAGGGAPSAGGQPEVGGNTAAGGSPSTVGGQATSGRANAGGGTAMGGSAASGGAKATGGRSGVGGASTTGGALATGGVQATGGRTGTGGSTGVGGGSASGGNAATGGAATCSLPAASQFQANLSIGGGGTPYEESDHFIVFGSASVDATLNLLEAAYQCFVEEWCWRWPGLSITSTSGTYYKFNIYQLASIGGAAGVMQYDTSAGLSYIQVLPNYSATAGVSVHEFGHSLTLAEKNWVNQGRTGLWWESMANFVADTFQTSPICANARSKHNITNVRSVLEPDTVISNSHMILCVEGNHYQAWPIFAYLTNNPDNYPGLGKMAVPNLFRTYKVNSNETPLHTLERLAAPTSVQTIVGRYWARMAYVDIGNQMAQQAFLSVRSRLNFSNLTASGSGTFTVIAARQPKYMGANIIPLTVSGSAISVQVTNLGNGRTESNFTATLAIRATSANTVRYVDLPSGSGSATIASGEEASLVVVNTPNTLYLYDPSNVGATDPANTGLNYRVQLTGATPAN